MSPGERPSKTRTSPSGSSTGSGRRRNALTALNIALFAPMPRASVTTATAVNPGVFQSIRNPYRKSCQRVFIFKPQSESLESRVKSAEPLFYSYLSASIGSTFVARLAGT
jgi:hypothetical protein